jgi:tetratricopeptide (TPR) repeat protein
MAAAAATILVAAVSLALATVLLQSANSREIRSRSLAEENLGLYRESIDRFYNNILNHPEVRTASMETLRRDLLELGKEAYERNLVPRINTPATRAQLGRTYLRYAQILDHLGDTKHALAHFQKALSVFEPLNRSVPPHAEYLGDEARVLCELGRWHQSNSPPGTAIPVLERAVSLLESAARRQPGDAKIRYELALARGVLGRVYSSIQFNPLALETLRRSIADLDALESEHPGVIENRDGLARSLMYIGDAYRYSGDLEQAGAALERLGRVCEALIAGSPGNPEYQSRLGQAYMSRAALLSERKRPMADVIPEYRKAMGIFETLASAHPDVPDYKNQIVSVALALALCHHVLNQPSLMRQFADQALSQLDRLTQEYPDMSLYRNEQAQARIFHALALARLREYAKAEQELDQTVRDITSPGWKYVLGYKAILAHCAASGYAVTAESVLSDASLPPSERAVRAAACQRQAIAQLRRSFEAGYPATLAEFEEWKKDEDIRVLGTNREFQELVSEIDAKLRRAPRPVQPAHP